MGVHGVDLGACPLGRLQESLHDRFAAGLGEVARLRLRHLYIWELLQSLLKTLLAVDGRGRTWRTLQLDDVPLAAQLLAEPFGGHVPFGHEVRRDQRGVKRI